MLMFEGISLSVSAAMDLVLAYSQNNISILNYIQGDIEEKSVLMGRLPLHGGQQCLSGTRSALGRNTTRAL